MGIAARGPAAGRLEDEKKVLADCTIVLDHGGSVEAFTDNRIATSPARSAPRSASTRPAELG
jgi:hypothetical protein